MWQWVRISKLEAHLTRSKVNKVETTCSSTTLVNQGRIEEKLLAREGRTRAQFTTARRHAQKDALAHTQHTTHTQAHVYTGIAAG